MLLSFKLMRDKLSNTSKLLSLLLVALLTACAEHGGATPDTAQLESLGIQAYHGKQAKALSELRYWAEQGLPVAQREMAIYAQSQTAGYAEAAAWYAKAAKGGDAESAYALGDAHYAGKLALQKDPVSAWSWFSMAAKAGNDKAALMLSRMTKYGEGVSPDLALSTYWLQQSSERGNAQAMFLLSNAYLYGEGVARNPELARTWLEKSAQGDFPVAIQALALAVEGGDLELSKDPERARHLLKEATDERRMHWNTAQ